MAHPLLTRALTCLPLSLCLSVRGSWLLTAPGGKEWATKTMKVWCLAAGGGVVQSVQKRRGVPEGEVAV